MNCILKDENAVYYECGYSCDNVILLQFDSEGFFITDGRYVEEAKESLSAGYSVVLSSNLLKSARQILRKSRVKTAFYDPKDWDVGSFKALQNVKVNFKAKPNLSWKKRAVKTKNEIELLQQAVTLGAQAFENFSQDIQSGLDEYGLNFKAKKALSFEGRYDLSFSPIVALNANASKPHALPRADSLKKGDMLLMDAGLKYQRYCSDRTRTAFFDEGFSFDLCQKFSSKKLQKAYDTVLKAHDRAIEKAKVGMKAKEIDKLAREVIEKAGFGEYFIHSTGHGVGLDIHEMPFISSKSETVIKEGMVYTIEPGIYLPGEFGIRIEDMVVMQQSGAKVL